MAALGSGDIALTFAVKGFEGLLEIPEGAPFFHTFRLLEDSQELLEWVLLFPCKRQATFISVRLISFQVLSGQSIQSKPSHVVQIVPGRSDRSDRSRSLSPVQASSGLFSPVRISSGQTISDQFRPDCYFYISSFHFSSVQSGGKRTLQSTSQISSDQVNSAQLQWVKIISIQFKSVQFSSDHSSSVAPMWGNFSSSQINKQGS